MKPEMLWYIFHEICVIPHPSGREAELRDFLRNRAKASGLNVSVDDVGNLLIEKSACPDREKAKTVILQGHLDMVPQKNSSVEFDFNNDAIVPCVQDGWITASKTTLGADNGIGVAAAMAVMLSKDISHGPLKALFTVQEETGLNGAMGLNPDFLQGDILINLDSEDENKIFTGCAGGARASYKFIPTWESAPEGYCGLKVSVTGLRGGHSGCDIDKGRCNANKIIVSLLKNYANDFDLRVVSIAGGTLDNAIPREAFAIIALPDEQVVSFAESVNEFYLDLKSAFSDREPEMKIEACAWELTGEVWSQDFQRTVLQVLCDCPHGVIRMSRSIPGLVETSTNLAVIETTPDVIKIKTSQRSSFDADRRQLTAEVSDIFIQAGASASIDNEYPGWAPDSESEILRLTSEIHLKLFGAEPEITAIHAGLECGIIEGKNPHLDMISIGPEIRNAHSPDEKVEVASVERFWNLLTAILEQV